MDAGLSSCAVYGKFSHKFINTLTVTFAVHTKALFESSA